MSGRAWRSGTSRPSWRESWSRSSRAGKSTLVRLLIREERPTRGQLVVHASELGTLPRRRLPRFRRSVGLVFQDFKLLPGMTVHENVAFALRVLGQPRRAVQRRTTEALETVGLSGLGDK